MLEEEAGSLGLVYLASSPAYPPSGNETLDKSLPSIFVAFNFSGKLTSNCKILHSRVSLTSNIHTHTFVATSISHLDDLYVGFTFRSCC
jgi:hypothetical protein